LRVWFAAVFALFLLAPRADGQLANTGRSITAATVSGIVFDSLNRVPLRDANVQLVSANNPAGFARTATSDSLGRFDLTEIPDGLYTLGFFHPRLDTLGLQAPLREVFVGGGRPVRVDLAIPSASRLRVAICGKPNSADSGAVLAGVVRNAVDGEPAESVTVKGEWLELAFTPKGMIRRMPGIVTKTGKSGWFAMCNLPSLGTVLLSASRGADSTDLIEVPIPADGFVRRELYLGAVQSATSRESRVTESGNRMHIGDVRLSGTVVAAADGRPVADALVSITEGPQTRANARGEWAFTNAPAGTRMIEVRALGFYPERRHVHVVPGAAPLRISLPTLKAVLDTVRVRAARYNRDRSGFSERAHTGPGRYLTPADIARRPATFTTDLFRMIPGLRIGFATDTLFSDMVISIDPNELRETDRRVLMRGITGNWCTPAIYLDGVHFPSLDADAIDAWIRPNNVAGVEIYSEATVLSQFEHHRSGCGTVVIWKK
jgi:hypothetical protein